MESNIKEFDDLILKVKGKEEFIKRVNSSGGVQLINGTVLDIKNNFFYLENLWKSYLLNKSLGRKKQLLKLFEQTNGGLFDSGEFLIKLENIEILFRL